MDKQQAQNIIRETFEKPFDKDRYAVFIKNLLNYIDESPFIYQGNYIPDAYKQYVRSLERIGKFEDGENRLDLLVITLKKETSLERARTMQRNFIAWYLNGSRGGEMKDAALVAYVAPDKSDWRFSLVKMGYTFEKKGKSGKMKVKEEFTPARRWSFLVGVNEKSHTAQSRLVNILANDDQAPTLVELEQAFDIETVTKEFFLKYRELFLRTKEALDRLVNNDSKVKVDFESKGVDTVNFAKKLLGQIVFLYFLQKKGWFGVGRDDDWGTGSIHFLRGLFEKTHGDYTNFFNDILEPLFYEALRIDRSHDDDYYSRFNCKIPFLNGGLFDPIGNYDWVHTDIHLPDELFSNTRQTPDGDIGNGILDVFDRYNFTVREDEPLEKEVAIDPELLGKAYEKFNAIRPDNFDEFTKALKSGKKGQENKFNKKFGVYYTPREIVHYMCKQSLINYLYTLAEESGLSSAIQKQDIEDLIEVGEMITEHEATALVKQENIKNGIQKSTEYTALLADSIRENASAIDKWLEEITVCDPAVGSGAFPVGMMNEIVRTRNVLSIFLNNKQRNDYEFKRHCIEHSLYGVDIDPGAVEIAKLRLWLSLVVDEEDIKNIKPLPNLDYKIVCGNSLIVLPEHVKKVKGVEEIQVLKKKFFSETNPRNKNKLKNEIDNKINKFLNTTKKNIGYHVDFDFKIYFSEVFHNKGGFDVVIANPPYLRIQEIKKNASQLAKQLKDNFVSAIGSFDIYVCFVEQAEKLINEKGNIAFILPHKFFQASFGKNLRQLISSKKMLRKIVNFGSSQVFETATTYTCLLFLSYQNRSFEFAELKPNATVKDLLPIFHFIDAGKQDETDKVALAFLSNSEVDENEWHFSTGDSSRILAKLQKQPRRLSDVCKKIFVGLQTSADKIYFLQHISENNSVVNAYSKSLDKEIQIEKDFVKPLLKGADVHRYANLNPKIWCIFPYKIQEKRATLYSPKDIEKKFPMAWEYLLQNRHALENREKGKMAHEQFYAYIYPKNLAEFEETKIVTPDIASGCQLTLDENNLYHTTTIYSFIFKRNIESIKYLLALLNSNLLWYFLTATGSVLRGGFFRFKTNYLMPFPIPHQISTEEQQPFIILADKIFALTKDDEYLKNPAKQAQVKEYEKQIDHMVYELYGLTNEEIKIVEGEAK